MQSISEDATATDTLCRSDAGAVADIEAESAPGTHMDEVSVKHVLVKDADDIESHHHVWRPKQEPNLPNLLRSSSKTIQTRRQRTTLHCTTVPPFERSESRKTILMRQQYLLDRIQAAQAVLKESTDELLSPSDKKPSISFKEASKRVISHQRKQAKGHSNFSDIVTQYMARNNERTSNPVSATNAQIPTYTAEGGSQKKLYQRRSTRGLLGAIPIDEWQKLMEENSL